MKRIILRTLLFIAILSCLCLVVFYNADGHTDGLYLKFTTPKQSSLILGTSKAAQGIHPTVINEILGRKDVYNYAFSIVHSPFGPAYLNSIKKKLKKTKQEGLFIVAVDPHSISSKSQRPNDSLTFKENNLALGQVENVNSDPNFEYLINYYPEKYIYILTRKLDYVSQGFVHDDGLIETGLETDSSVVAVRTKKKIRSYVKQTKQYRFSETRFQYLIKTIKFLKQQGDVYLVRLPVAEPLLKLENSIIPDFDCKMNEISEELNLDYLNLTTNVNNYSYDDGNHLDWRSGKIASKEIAEWIKSLK